MNHDDARKNGGHESNVHDSDDRPAAARKRLADVRLDMDLMNALTESRGTDSACMGELMVRHERLVWNVLRRIGVRGCDVDDVAGKVWVKIWEMARKGRWDATRARHVRDPFVPLLKRVCKSNAKDFHRTTGRKWRREQAWVEAAKTFGSDWRNTLRGPRRTTPAASRPPRPDGVPAWLEGRVVALPEPLRRVYELHANGLTNRTISGEVGCSYGEVSKRLNRAREIMGLPTTRKKSSAAAGSRSRVPVTAGEAGRTAG